MTPVIPVPPRSRRLGHHALEGFKPPFVDDAGDLGDLAAQDVASCRGQAAENAHRKDAVADHQIAGLHPLEMQAIDFIARESGHDRHGSTPGDATTVTRV